MTARSMIEARALIYKRLEDIRAAGRRGKIYGVDFVLCEDSKTVMVYLDLDDEEQAIAIWFDLNEGEAFNYNRYRSEFFRPMVVS